MFIAPEQLDKHLLLVVMYQAIPVVAKLLTGITAVLMHIVQLVDIPTIMIRRI